MIGTKNWANAPSTGSSSNVKSVVWAGEELFKIRQDNGPSVRTEIWAIENPTKSKAGNVVITLSESCEIYATATNFYGVNLSIGNHFLTVSTDGGKVFYPIICVNDGQPRASEHRIQPVTGYMPFPPGTKFRSSNPAADGITIYGYEVYN
jgi:hypothetical protein